MKKKSPKKPAKPAVDNCPFCGSKAKWILGSINGYASCKSLRCSVEGPVNDPDAKKWNAVARKVKRAKRG